MQETLRKTAVAGTAAMLAMALSAPAFAGFYAGGGIGDSIIETSENTPNGSFDFDESDFAWKLFGGYMFSEYLGVEAGYFDMGSPSQKFSFSGGQGGAAFDADLRAELSGFTLQGVAAYPFGPLEVFGKLGIVSYEGELEIRRRDTGDVTKLDDDGEELAYGIGGKYRVGDFALRVEYDIYDAGGIDDVSMWTFGAELRF